MNKGWLSFLIFFSAFLVAAVSTVRSIMWSEWIWAVISAVAAIGIGRFILLGIYHGPSGEAPFLRGHKPTNYYEYTGEKKPNDD